MIYINASALKLLHCNRRFYLTVNEGWTSKIQPNDVIFGSALHKFLKNRHFKNPHLAALEARVWFEAQNTIIRKAYLTPQYFTETCQKLLKRTSPYTTINTGTENALVEQTFEIPLSPNIRFCGTIDDMAEDSHENIYFRDWKSTGSYNRGEFLNNHALSTQLIGYLWGIRTHQRAWPASSLSQKKFTGAIIEGIFLTTSGAEFQTSDVFSFKDETLDFFEERLMELVARMPENSPTGLFNNSCCSGKDFPCDFFDYCRLGAKPEFLKANYNQAPYNPTLWN